MSNVNGYFEKLVIFDTETSGLNSKSSQGLGTIDEGYQIVSIGLIIVNSTTLKKVEELYLEIKWNGVSKWDKKAEQIHGLSLTYLEENGVDEEDAVLQIGGLFLKHFGDSPIKFGGHNVHFDLAFLRGLFKRINVPLYASHRFYDTNSVGWALFNTYTSNELFELVAPARKNHNSLEDANLALQVFKVARALAKEK